MVAQFPRKNVAQVPSPIASIEAEESVLGAILFCPDAISKAINVLEAEAFYLAGHQIIYSACLEVYKIGQKVDFLLVKEYLAENGLLEKVGGLNKLTALADSTVNTFNVEAHAELITRKWLQRQAICQCNEIISIASTYIGNSKESSMVFLEEIENKMLELTRGNYRGNLRNDEATRIADKIAQEIRHIENTVSNPVHKEYKLMVLAKKHKMARKALESLYVKILLAQENEPTEIISEFIKKYGNECNEWFMQGLLPKGSVILLHALGGVGKTRLAYDFCFCLATGIPWNGFPVTAQSRSCLLVQTDETRGDLIRCLESRGFKDDLPVYIKSKWTVDHLPSLREDIIKYKIEVVVIDSLTTVSKSSIFSENDTHYAKPVLQMKDLAQELGVTVLLIHHSNSSGKSRGTKAIHNSVSQVLSLKLPSEGSDANCRQRLLVIEKSRFRRPTKYQLEYVINEKDFSWNWECYGESLEQPDPEGELKEEIIRFLSENRNSNLGNSDIAQALQANYNTVRRATFELATDGLIVKHQVNSQGRPWVFALPWEEKTGLAPEEKPQGKVTEQEFSVEVEYIGQDAKIKNAVKNAQKVEFVGFNPDTDLAELKVTCPNWIHSFCVDENDIKHIEPNLPGIDE